jgi:hypothetical protein
MHFSPIKGPTTGDNEQIIRSVGSESSLTKQHSLVQPNLKLTTPMKYNKMTKQIARGNEAYRFSATYTLSDFPLLIGEILRRNDLRSQKRARRKSLIRKITGMFAMRQPLSKLT